MQMPSSGLSTERQLDDYGEHHLAALGADKKTAQLRASFERAQQSLRGALESRYLAERKLIADEALSAQDEVDLEDALRVVEAQLMLATKKQRQLDPYRGVFPKGLTGALAPRGADQVLEAQRILRTIAASAEAAEAAGSATTALDAATKTLAARLETQSAAEASVVTAHTAEQVQKRRWREQYKKSHGELIALYPSDKRKVEAFFKKPTKRDRPAASEPPELVQVAKK